MLTELVKLLAHCRKDFAGFERKVVPNLSKFVMLTRYQASIDAPVAYMPEALKIHWVSIYLL